MKDRLFLDTAFIQAMLNERDQYHDQAKRIFPRVRTAAEVWITEAVLVEVGNALADIDRQAAVTFIRQCYQTENIRVVPVTTTLLKRGLLFYESRRDKGWGLTDCISFVVMEDEGLKTAVTTDIHFIQAGFQALLTDN